MSITYPINTPTSIGIGSINLRAVNAVSISQSPFTYKQQVIAHPGQRWEATVTMPPVHRDLAAPWKAFVTKLKGPVGTFLLSDPDYVTPRGDVSSCSVTGVAGDESVTVTMTGTLLEGDYIQLGSGSSSRLHQVLQDQTGDGTLEIWPKLRASYTDAPVVFNSAKGVFRLANGMSSWDIDNMSVYGISFDCIEAIV